MECTSGKEIQSENITKQCPTQLVYKPEGRHFSFYTLLPRARLFISGISGNKHYTH